MPRRIPTFLPFALILLAAAGARGEGTPSLEIVPFPLVSTLEPAVAAQIQGVEMNLAALRAAEGASRDVLAEAYGDIGQLFHAYELWDSAAAAYRNAIRLAPRDTRSMHLLAEVAMKTGDLEEARRRHAQVLALQPDDLASRVGLGEALLGLNRPEDAGREFLEATRTNPGSAAAHAGLGRTALARRDFAQARTELEIAVRLAPEATRLHYELAMAWRGLGNRDEAARELARAGTVGVRVSDPVLEDVSARRRGERTHLVRGRLAFVNGRMRESADEFAAAVEAEPRSVAGLVGLGSALAMLGETDRALDAFNRALAVAPANVAAHSNVGRLLLKRGDFAGATRHLRRVVEAEPEGAEGVRLLARSLAAQGDTAEALRLYATAVRLAPHDEDAALGHADLLARLGRFADAREALEDGHRRMPDKGRLALALAYLLAASPETSVRDGARALELARAVHAAAPGPETGRTVALALAELGRCAEAEEWLDRLLGTIGRDGAAATADLRADRDRAARGAPCRPPGRSPRPAP